MSDPYVIWTMRRTGGTTLATLLSTLTEHPGVPHEPFNTDRKFGHVTQAFLENRNKKQLRAALQEGLAQRPVIKHCHELIGPVFNATLMQVTTELGYRHIVLDRRRETDRIISLELAQLTGAWGSDAAKKIYPAIETGEVMLEPMNLKHAVHQLHLCHQRRLELAKLMRKLRPAPFVVYFEDVYTDPDAGRALIARLLAFLGIAPEDHAEYDQLVEDALLLRGQNTARIVQAVPNFDAAVTELDSLQAGLPQVFTAS